VETILARRPGCPIGDAGAEELQLGGRVGRREEPESRVPLQHRPVGVADHLQLEVVVHHGQVRDPGVIGGAPHSGQHRSQRGRTARRLEGDQVHAELHGSLLPACDLRACGRDRIHAGPCRAKALARRAGEVAHQVPAFRATRDARPRAGHQDPEE
jgi:hypothetical protein